MVFISLLLFLVSGFFLFLIGVAVGAKAAYKRVEDELDSLVERKLTELELAESFGTKAVAVPKRKSPRQT